MLADNSRAALQTWGISLNKFQNKVNSIKLDHFTAEGKIICNHKTV